MDIKEYQSAAWSTAIYNDKGNNIYYPAMGLCSEAGEVIGKIKKIFRDKQGVVTEDYRAALKDELGDVAWYWAVLCRELNLDPEEVLLGNIDKLKSREVRGKLGGDGDER